MTQPSKTVRFAALAFGILFFDSAALGQQSQSWKFPLSIPTTQSGFPSPVVASTGPLAVGTYSITAKTSLQNLYAAREPSGKCYLVLLDVNGNVIPDSQLDETDVTLDQTSNGADTASLTLSAVYVVTAVGPNNVGVHCMASQKSQFMNTVITATSLQGPPGPQGAAGLPGAPGAAATVQVGSTTTLGSNGLATVTNTGSPNAAVLSFAIPQGQTGATGPAGTAATVTVGTTTTGLPGTPALVTNAGSLSAAFLNFVIPQGATGAQGPAGPKGDPGPPGTANSGFPSNFMAFTGVADSFVVPNGVTTIQVEAVGGGGGGDPLGSGGGSGAYQKVVLSATPGSVYSISVGRGGNPGSVGGATIVRDQNGVVVACGANGFAGGLGGLWSSSCAPIQSPPSSNMVNIIGQQGVILNQGIPVVGNQYGGYVTVPLAGGAPVMLGAGAGGWGGPSAASGSPGYVLISW